MFIGPCIAKSKKRELLPIADYVISFEELAAMFEAKDIDVSSFELQGTDCNDASNFGKGFALSGGVAGAVARVFEEENYNEPFSYIKCDGARECKKALQMLGAGRLNETFVEGMACENGCIAGPVGILPLRQALNNRKKLIAQADDRSIDENLQKHDFLILIYYASRNNFRKAGEFLIKMEKHLDFVTILTYNKFDTQKCYLI